MLKISNLIIMAILLAIGNSNHLFASPVSATIQLQAYALLTEFDAITETAHVTDSPSDSWGTLLSPLNISTSITAADPNQTVTASGDASATWGTDGNSGKVFFDNFGLSGDAHHYSISLRNDPNSVWNYTFVADYDGFLSMTYDVSVLDDIGIFGTFGLAGWNIEWSGVDGGLALMNAFDPIASGLFSRPVIAGELYTIGLSGGPSLGFGSGGSNNVFSAHIQGNFNFTISPVPEPSVFAMLMLGLLSLSIFNRIRKVQVSDPGLSLINPT